MTAAPEKTIRIWWAILIAVIVLIYIQGLTGEFLWDDKIYFEENDIIPNLRPWNIGSILFEVSNYWGDHLPALTFLFVAEHTLFGPSTFGYHVTSLSMYILLCFMVYSFLLELYGIIQTSGDKKPGKPPSPAIPALAVTTLFSLHPAQVEVVSYITGQRDLLSGIFVFLCFIFLLKAYRNDLQERKKAAGSIALFVFFYYLAFLSKLTTVSAGLFITLLWLFVLRKNSARPVYAIAFWAVVNVPVMLWLLHTTNILQHYGVIPSAIPAAERLIRAVRILGAQTVLLLKPYPLNFGYPFDKTANTLDMDFIAGSAVLIVPIVSLIRRPRSLVTVGLLIYVSFYFPVLQLFKELVNATIYSRYLFIPILGAAILIERFFSFALSKHRKMLPVIICAFLAICLPMAGLSHATVPMFRSELASLEHAYKTFPGWNRAAFDYVYVLIEEGRLRKAAELTETEPTFDRPLWVRDFFRGWIYLESGLPNQAKYHLRQARYNIMLGGYFPFTDLHLAKIYLEEGNRTKAREYLNNIINSTLYDPVYYFRAKEMMKMTNE